ncbi:Mus7/MMS22 family-domain-containing protein [Lactarius vividus]|nr:Mus7/MMS22 family-domain-containing protein [Lactarius vividus]
MHSSDSVTSLEALNCLLMDPLLDAASTSDVNEREILESASSEYWERVLMTANDHLELPPPGASSDLDINDMEGVTTEPMVYQRSTAVPRDALAFLPHPTLHASSSSPATHVSLSMIENSTTPGWSGHGPPTSSPVSPPIPASPSVSSLTRRYKIQNSELSPDPLQIISSSGERDERHASFPTDDEMLDPAFSPNSEGHRHDAMLGGLAGGLSPPPIRPMQPSPSVDPFVVPAPAPTQAIQDEVNTNDSGGVNATGGRYSMRTRQPRQLKPYAIDRLEYKHQLKHHPDAIVRFAGLRNPAESSPSPAPPSDAGESGTDGIAGNSASDHSFNHMPVHVHTKGKKRRRTGTEQHLSRHRETVPLVTTSLGRVRSGPSVVEVFPRVASLPDQGEDDVADAPAPWYPDVFNDMSSGLGSDDEPLNAVQQPPRRAPRNLPNLSPLASPRPPSSRSPSPRAKPPSELTISSDTSTEESSSGSESGDVALLSERSFVMLVDTHTLSPSPEPERSPPKASQKRRLQPSKYPVITDFFGRQSRESEKTSRKRSTTRGEKGVPPEQRKSKGRTSRRRERQKRPVDLSVFTVVGRRVLSGWQRRNAVTIDAEDIAFRKALEPLAIRARQPPSVPIRPPPRLSHVRRPPRHRSKDRTAQDRAPSTSRVPDPEPDREVRQRIVVDFDIPFLSSGKVFTASCYLGRGWLHELLSVLSGTPPSHPPPRFEVDGHALSSISTALDYTVFLPYACDSFAKILDDPQSISHDAFVRWNTDMHAVCSLASWISSCAAGNNTHLIRTASLEYTGSLIARIDTALGDSEEQAKSLSPSMLCLQWFAIELLVRTCWSAMSSDEDLTTAVSARLVGFATRLLRIGVQAALSPVIDNSDSLDDFSLHPCAAEFWICLIHLGAVHGMTAAAPGQGRLPSMVDILQRSLVASESSAQGSLHASEEIWATLFGLCALSQFSAHGVSTSTSRLSTSWEIVLLALDRIRLVADPQVDDSLSSRNLRRRDAYVRLVVSRCFLLHQRWHWRLEDDASAAVFRRLVEIFKSRRFADLRGEIAGFPAFAQENDPHLLAQHASTDSAFSIFLKLIYASAQQMRPPAMREEEYTGRIKKLLSLITPVGSVQAQPVHAPRSALDDAQLSMLYNRFGALALAMRVLPSAENAQYRISLARRYIDVVRASAPTRAVCIRAATLLALQALDMALPVAPALEWSTEIARVLLAEFRAAVGAGRMERVQCVQLLLYGLGDVSRAATSPPAGTDKDPSTALEVLHKGTQSNLLRDALGCLFPVLSEAELCGIPTVQTLLQGILDSHLNYALSLQEDRDREQPLQPVNQEESQDEYGQFDLNWDDPMVLAALDSTTEPRPPLQYTYQSIVEVRRLGFSVIDRHT